MSHALKLLTSYDSDDELEDEDREVVPPKKKIKFPLPEEIKGLYEKEAKLLIPDDDPGAHEFRVRSFRHVPGNWATYVYVEIKNMESIQSDLLQIFQQHGYETKLMPHPHISLSKVVNLQHSWITEFVACLRNTLLSHHKFPIGWKAELQTLANEQKTRTFMALSVHPSTSSLLSKLVESVDRLLSDYKLETFYDPPLFHSSLLWTLGDQQKLIEDDKNLLEAVNSKISQFIEESMSNSFAESVACRCGDRVYSIKI